jgi:hypothetical protein
MAEIINRLSLICFRLGDYSGARQQAANAAALALAFLAGAVLL